MGLKLLPGNIPNLGERYCHGHEMINHKKPCGHAGYEKMIDIFADGHVETVR